MIRLVYLLMCLPILAWAVHYDYHFNQCYSDDECPDFWKSTCYNNECVPATCKSTDGQECISNLLSCNLTSGTCDPEFCVDDDECDVANTVCRNDRGYCDCLDGHSHWNGQCSQVPERACIDDRDCYSTGNRYTCKDSRCSCDSDTWYQQGDGCNSYLGQSCSSWKDCGKASNTTCMDGQCTCLDGFVNYNGDCQSFYGRHCQNTTDCGNTEGLYCSTYQDLPHSQPACRCAKGYARSYKDELCTKVLGTSCGIVGCGNSSHWSYMHKHIYFYTNDFSAQGAFYDYYHLYHRTYFCNLDNMCTCSKGYRLDNEDLDCVQIYGSPCASDNECGGPVGMFKCDINTGYCTCGNKYTSVDRTNSDNYNSNYNWIKETICAPCLPCLENGCPITGAKCNEIGTCTCDLGHEVNGECKSVLSNRCDLYGPCKLVKNAVCGTDNTCACAEGFMQNITADSCEQVLSSTCINDEECSNNLSGTLCSDGVCVCEGDLIEHNSQCLSSQCAVIVPALPDVYRRSPAYKLARDEPMIRDDKLTEGWYSIGNSYLSDIDSIPMVGHCGTKYPMYLKESLTDTEKTTLADGEEVEKDVTLSGLSVYNISEDTLVRIRKCGDDIQVYLKPPTIAFAAFCVENGVSSNQGGNSSNRYAHFVQELGFYVDGENDDGADVYQPYVKFECHIYDDGHIRRPTDYQTNYYHDDDFYYTVHWYIESIHYTSFGPYKRSDLNSTILDEMDIRDDFPVLGFKIQCSYEWSESISGPRSAKVFSDETYTGITAVSLTMFGGAEIHNIYSATPLGCRGPLDGNVIRCSIKWTLVDNNNCSAPDTEAHPLCGMSLLGATIAGFNQYGRHWYGMQNSLLYEDSYTYENDTYMSIRKYYQNMIRASEFDDNNTSDTIFRAKFGAASSPEHPIWNGYILPDFKKLWVTNFPVDMNSCSVLMGKIPAVGKTRYDAFDPFDDHTTAVDIDAEGEYVLIRSNKLPIEAQIRVAKCAASLSGLCICSFTFRDVNSIYTFDLCDESYRGGFLHGNGNGNHLGNQENYFYFENGIGVYYYLRRDQGVIDLYLDDYYSSERFTHMDGLCSFESESYRLRSGYVSGDETGFVKSWAINTERSLFNPRNHFDYSWVDTFFPCECPSANETIENMTLVFDSETYRQQFIYTGVIDCTTKSKCSVEHPGTEWVGSLLPNYTLPDVIIHVKYIVSGTNALLVFICEFDAQDDKRYNITWFADDAHVYSSGIVSSNTVGFNQISAKTLLQHSTSVTSGYAVNIGWKCGVSVHNSEGVQLIAATYADTFNAITMATIFTSTRLHLPCKAWVPDKHQFYMAGRHWLNKGVAFDKTVLNIPRGRDVMFTFTLNIPLLCLDGQECYLDFKMYDETESHTCQDSTFAVKSEFTCGARVFGDRSMENVKTSQKVEMQLTTKNNNKYSLRSAFDLGLKADGMGKHESFLTGTFAERFTLIVDDDDREYWKGTYCYATNDPRMRTFDGLYYSIISSSLIDEFVMMRHKTLPIEIQLQTEMCNWGLAACGCGITVRAGRDVFTITHCNDDHVTETLLHEDNILEIRRRSPNRYQIYLPHGAMVDVYYFRSDGWATLNVNIYPSPSDIGQLEGLCGNFNGEWSDDLLHSDGNRTTVSGSYWGWTYKDPDVFSSSWGLMNTNQNYTSLLNFDYIERDLESWKTAEMKCVCLMSNNDIMEAMCSPNEDETCVNPVVKPGDAVKLKFRDTRSTKERDIGDVKERIERIRHIRSVDYAEELEMRKKRNSKSNPDAVNYTTAYQICEDGLSMDCSTKNLEGSLPNGTNITAMIEDCALDVMLNKSQNWFASSCAVMQGAVENVVTRDVVFQEQNPNITATITNATCVGSCSFHGDCVDGLCDCHEGYGSTDCSVDLNAPPVTKNVQGGGICNKGEKLCLEIRITTDGCIDGVQCQINHVEIGMNGVQISVMNRNEKGTCDNGYDVYCPVAAQGQIRKRSTETLRLADIYSISVSNNGKNYGTNNSIVAINAECLQFDKDSIDVHRSPEFCYIDGNCYRNGSTGAEDECQYCDVKDPFIWSYDKQTGLCASSDSVSKTTSDNNGSTVLIASLSAAGVIMIIVGVVVLYLYNRNRDQKLKRNSVDVHSGHTTDIYELDFGLVPKKHTFKNM